MRPLKFILVILIAAPFFGYRPLTNKVYVKGHIKKNPQDTSVSISHLTVFVKGDNKILTKAITNNKGDFELSFTPNKEESFDFYCNGVTFDSIFIASIIKFESDTPELTFYIPAKKKMNASGKVICPKCGRTDKVYKIEYTDAPFITKRVSKSGDTTYSALYKGTYQASDKIEPAKYYCDRDKIKF